MGVDTGMRYHEENSWLETDGVNTNSRYLALRSANVSAGAGLWRSTDGGSTWTRVSQPFGSATWIDCMAVDRATAGRVWVASNNQGVKRSDDGGSTWNSVGGFTVASRIDAANGRIAVWGRLSGDTWHKVYYSADNGTNWSEKSGSGHRYAHLQDLAVDPNRAGQIWISGNSVEVINPPGPTGVEIFRTSYGLTADGSQDALTPAGDGVANLLKYAFNMLGNGVGQAADLSAPNNTVLSPTGSAGLPFGSIETGTGKLQLTYVRRKTTSNPGIFYAVEFRDTLTSGTWSVNPAATETAVSLDAAFERVTLTDSTTPSQRFARVKVTLL